MILQKRFVESLASHNNFLMNEIFELERDVSWTDVAYQSPIGIIYTDEVDDADPHLIPGFYREVTDGSHRG